MFLFVGREGGGGRGDVGVYLYSISSSEIPVTSLGTVTGLYYCNQAEKIRIRY
jgi:hypothetical protein